MRERIVEIILAAIDRENELRDAPVDVSAGEDTQLYGLAGQVDSMGLVSLVVEVEETGIVSTTSMSSDSLYMKFNDPSTEYRIVEGELWLRSTRQILGYLNHPSDSFTDDGWFRTGDLVEEGEDGFLRIRGRRKEVINVGGEKVFPAEVESVLLKHPWVRDCRAYGQANGITGQFVAADIVLDAQCAGEADAALREIRAFARSNMDSYKAPVRLKAVDAIAYSARFKKLLGPSDQRASNEL